MNCIITISPDVQSCEPVFSGTRVQFVPDFPSLKREQVVELLSLAGHTFLFSDVDIHEEIVA
jgi:uncharacterized protein (DUF433 family)